MERWVGGGNGPVLAHGIPFEGFCMIHVAFVTHLYIFTSQLDAE